MREKWARVLAAALMTGAIGFALAMPAFFGTAHDAGRSLTAPPSFLQRSVHVVASAPSRSALAGQLEGTRSIRPAIRLQDTRSGSRRDGSTLASSRHSTTAGRSKPAPKPAPKPTPAPTPAPAPAPDTRELADTPAAAVPPPAASQPAASAKGKGKGRGKGKGHDKGKPPEASQPPVPAATPQPANESPANEGGAKNKDKDKGKSDERGRNG